MSKTSAARLTAAERKEKALYFRKQGYTYKRCAELVGVSCTRVREIIGEYLRELQESSKGHIEEMRQLELEKLDAQELRIHKVIQILPAKMMQHLPKFEEMLLKVRVHRAKLLGLIMPVQVLVPVQAPSDYRGRLEETLSDRSVQQVVGEIEKWEVPQLIVAKSEPEFVPAPAPREQRSIDALLGSLEELEEAAP